MTGSIERRRALPPREFVASILIYRDGCLFWRVRPSSHFKTLRTANVWNGTWAGKRAGSPMLNGYRMISIDGVKFLEHRLICHLMNGVVGVSDEVDHIDHDHTNNHAENLRACTHAQNSMNQPGRQQKYGPLPRHVHWSARERKFKVTLRANGAVHFIGTFADLSQADAAARAARKRLHGEYEFGRAK